jgi:molybdenum cofactor guanylyltransferase
VPSVYDRGKDGFLQKSFAAFVLAGGKSTRMGIDKAFVEFAGKTLLARALEVTRSVTSDVKIVGDAAKFAAFGPVVQDEFHDCGPLGGIHAALRASKAELNLMLAVDVPFVSPELLQYLVMCAEKMSDAVVTVPHVGGRWQPLCAIYRSRFVDLAERALYVGRYKIDDLFADVHVQTVEEKELIGAGFTAEMFRNLNTKEELEAACSVERRQNIAAKAD